MPWLSIISYHKHKMALEVCGGEARGLHSAQQQRYVTFLRLCTRMATSTSSSTYSSLLAFALGWQLCP